MMASKQESEEVKLSPLQEKIKDLELQYKELTSNLEVSKDALRVCEHNLLECLLKLMPLQNSYLGGIIASLQNQLKEQANLEEEQPIETNQNPNSRVRSRRRESNLTQISE